MAAVENAHTIERLLDTLDEVLNHYSKAPAAPAGHSELNLLNLSDTEKAQLIAFLKTLSGPLATAHERLTPPVIVQP